MIVRHVCIRELQSVFQLDFQPAAELISSDLGLCWTAACKIFAFREGPASLAMSIPNPSSRHPLHFLGRNMPGSFMPSSS
jgi:hypothetical protein